MKQKVWTLLEQDVVRRARRRAADEKRSLSNMIQDALERYLSVRIAELARRRRGSCTGLRLNAASGRSPPIPSARVCAPSRPSPG